MSEPANKVDIKLTSHELASISVLSTSAGMSPSAYIEMIIEQHILEYEEHFCPECQTNYRGTCCPCKASERL